MGHKSHKKDRDRSSSRHKSKKHKKDKKNKSRSRSRSRDKKQSKNEKKQHEKLDDHQLGEIYNLTKNDDVKNEIIKQELGYTNEENPFGDKNLGEKFTWKKKGQTSEYFNQDNHKYNQQDQQKYLNIQKTIRDVKDQRIKREVEQQKLDEEKQRAQKEKDEQQFQQWVEKEAKFNEELIKVRALVRLNFNQETPLDTLVKIYYVYRGKIKHQKRFEYLMNKPNKFFKSLNNEDLNIILKECIVQKNNEYQKEINFHKFWESVEVLVKNVIEQQQVQEGENLLRKNDLTEEFIEEVKEIYKGKTTQELEELQAEINETLNQNDEFQLMDQEYWQNVMKLVKIQKAKQVMKDFYTQFKIQLENNELPINNEKNQDQLNQQKGAEVDENEPEADNEHQKLNLKYQEEQENQKHILKEKLEDLSPKKRSLESIKEDPVILQQQKNLTILSQAEQITEIAQQRQVILEKMLEEAKTKYTQFLEQKKLKELQEIDEESDDEGDEQEYQDGIDALTRQAIFQQKNRKLDDDEQAFDDVYKVTQSEGGLLKRPEYHNTVKMQYDWNKYNQAHFDKDNPPPKIITGYKFNIFYQELADQKTTPQYYLEQCDEDNRFLILRFSAGPPYEDISFKIMNREWNFKDKKAFKCVYSKGILHLYFNFKRFRYRR